jgi:phosphopantothenoylcysteine synthetase/decarboxylase
MLKTKKPIHFLITAGGTREFIDPVRFISNASSGKMGYALAQAALSKGHKVTLISASDLQPPVGADYVGVETTEQMFEAVKKFYPHCDCLIMAAAVSDFTLIKKSKIKIKKSKIGTTLRLKPTPDILKWAGNQKLKTKNLKLKTKILVGFALEDKNLKVNAERKMKEKNLDIVIANSPSSIGSEKTEGFIKTAKGQWQKISLEKKELVAKKIIQLAEQLAK